jgi:hypothetical protein
MPAALPAAALEQLARRISNRQNNDGVALAERRRQGERLTLTSITRRDNVSLAPLEPFEPLAKAGGSFYLDWVF